jgi:hypothetical protein
VQFCGTARPFGEDGAFQGQFRLPAAKRLRPPLGLGDRRVGIEHVVFLPAERLKNGEKRLAMTSVARSIVDSQRGSHPGITIHLPRTASAEDKEFGMA